MMTTQKKSGDTLPKMEQISAILNGADLEKAWRDCLGAWEDSSPAQRADCRAFVVNLRDNFLRILRDVDDPEEQATIASIFYTQVKAQWILINTQSGYQIRNGRVEGALFCKAGMLSALLGSLEPVLHKTDLTRITNFLAEPEATLRENSLEATQLSALLGVEVAYEIASPEEEDSSRIIVDAKSITNRFRELVAKIDESERQWSDLQSDLGVKDRSEIIDLFEKIQRRPESSEEAGSEAAISLAAQAEWSERRELQLRAMRKELGTLRADWDQVQTEIRVSDSAALIELWRVTNDALKSARTELATERSSLAALRAEYGDEVTAVQVIGELRRLSSELAQAQSAWETLHTESKYLEREFGTFNAQQMVALVRNLRDKVGELSAQVATGVADRESLSQEFGTSEVGAIITQVRELRDNLSAASREIIPLRADRYVLQNELGKTDVREIVSHMRILEARIESYREMSELLGSMEQALKTLE